MFAMVLGTSKRVKVAVCWVWLSCLFLLLDLSWGSIQWVYLSSMSEYLGPKAQRHVIDCSRIQDNRSLLCKMKSFRPHKVLA